MQGVSYLHLSQFFQAGRWLDSVAQQPGRPQGDESWLCAGPLLGVAGEILLNSQPCKGWFSIYRRVNRGPDGLYHFLGTWTQVPKQKVRARRHPTAPSAILTQGHLNPESSSWVSGKFSFLEPILCLCCSVLDLDSQMDGLIWAGLASVSRSETIWLISDPLRAEQCETQLACIAFWGWSNVSITSLNPYNPATEA